MKERPNLDELINGIQKMIDENQRSLLRYVHVGTLMDILYFLKEQKLREQCIKTKCVICPHCEHCDVDEMGQIKEQEAVPVDTKIIGMPNGTDIEVYCCRDCREVLDPAFNYCPNCGLAVKWRDNDRY